MPLQLPLRRCRAALLLTAAAVTADPLTAAAPQFGVALFHLQPPVAVAKL